MLQTEIHHSVSLILATLRRYRRFVTVQTNPIGWTIGIYQIFSGRWLWPESTRDSCGIAVSVLPRPRLTRCSKLLSGKLLSGSSRLPSLPGLQSVDLAQGATDQA